MSNLSKKHLVAATETFQVSSPSAGLTVKLDITTSAVAFSGLAAELDGMTVTCSLKTRHGREYNMYTQTSLLAIVEHFTRTNGACMFEYDSVNDEVDSITVFIPFTYDGACLELSRDQNVNIEIAGLTAGAANYITVYSLENEQRTHEAIQWNSQNVPSGEYIRKIKANESSELVVEGVANQDLNDIQLNYTTGTSARFERLELLAMTGFKNEKIFVPSDFITPTLSQTNSPAVDFPSALKYFILDVDTANEIIINTDSTGTIKAWVIGTVDYAEADEIREIAQNNAKIESTTLGVRSERLSNKLK